MNPTVNSRPIVGLIGLGYWGSKYLRLLRESSGVGIGFVVDSNPDALDSLTIEKTARRYLSLKEAWEDNAASSVSGVIVVTPAASHREIVQDCLEHRLHVLVEKPMALRVEDAVFLSNLSKKVGRVLFPGHVYAHNDTVRKMSSLVRSGDLGGIRYVTCNRSGLGPVRGDTNVVWDLVPHDLSALHLLGLSNPDSVVAIGSSFVRPGIEDVAFTTLRYPSGAIVHIQSSWLDPYKVRRITIVGDKRMAIFDDVAVDDQLRIYERGVDITPSAEYGEFKAQIRSGDIHIPFVKNREPLRNMLESFIQAWNNQTMAEEVILRGVWITSVLEAINRSLRSGGKEIRLDWKPLDEVANLPQAM